MLNTFVTRPSELLHITVETDAGERETIVGTAPHPFYVERVGGFVPASDLQLGDRLSLPEGRSASVLLIRHERAAAGSPFTTFNFEVADHHTYFVGNADVWVHNRGATPCQFAEAKFSKAYDKARALGLTRHWRIGDRDLPGQVASQQSLPPFLPAPEFHSISTTEIKHWTSE